MELGLLRAPRNVVCDSQEVSWERTLASREKKSYPLFLKGLSQVEAVLGESPVLAGRIERSTFFAEWKSSLWPFMKTSWSENACPDFLSKLILWLSNFWMVQSADFFLSRAPDSGEITVC